jgi:UDP:flavonoid glycosyltransferase YjiC (YdhE family)
LQLTDFPLFDERTEEPLPKPVRGFLDAGPPPVVVTFGSAMQHGQAHFAAAVEGIRRTGRRGLLLTPHREQIARELPGEIAHFDYVPFSQLLPCSAALIHHGGIGTCAQALAAGVPQIVVPLSHDQPDNANRLERLGVGRGIFPNRFKPTMIAKVLSGLLDDPGTADACRAAAKRFAGVDGTSASCDFIEQMAERFWASLKSCNTNRP